MSARPFKLMPKISYDIKHSWSYRAKLASIGIVALLLGSAVHFFTGPGHAHAFFTVLGWGCGVIFLLGAVLPHRA